MCGKNIGIVFLVLLFLLPAVLGAFDIGLVTDHNLGHGGIGGESTTDYKMALIPRLSFLIGDSVDFFFSGGFNLGFEDKNSSMVPELLRTEFSWSFSNAKIRAGRIQYADPLGFIANGLFDGAQFLYDTTVGSFSAGAWYTGLLYKKRANITITPEDFEDYYKDNTYFASRRIVAAVDWEHPSIAEMLQLKLGILGQIDISDRKDLFHSQFLSGKMSVPVASFLFELGVGVELMEFKEEMNLGFAGEAGVYWTPPFPFNSRFSFTGRLTSGKEEEISVAAFTPVTTTTQGDILKANLSGLSVFSLDYLARFHQTFSAGVTASYFLRSDLGTYMDYPVSNSGEAKRYFMGSELAARLIWSPVSDLRFNFGGGMFLPSMGDIAPDADPKWRIELGAVLALF